MKVSIIDVPQREVVVLNKQQGIFNNGLDNAYPQRVERIINNSVTAKAAADKAKAFFIGNGFTNKELNDIVVYKDINGEITMYDLLVQVSHSVSRQKAAALKIQYNGNYDIAGVKQEPYRNCRIGKTDSIGYSGFIHVYHNWEKRQGEQFRPLLANKIHIYNPIKSVVEKQFATSGYKGQISLLLLDDEFIYPLAQIDPALEDADTEAQIKGYKNSELRKGFFPKGILYHTSFADDTEQQAFKDTMRKFEGGDSTARILMAEAIFNDDGTLNAQANFKYEEIKTNVDDKMFDLVEKSCANNIRKAMWNIPSILIEQQDGAMFGQSGEAMKSAFEIYNAETKFIRRKISQWFKEIFSHYDNEVLKNADFTINELTYGTLDINGTTANKTA